MLRPHLSLAICTLLYFFESYLYTLKYVTLEAPNVTVLKSLNVGSKHFNSSSHNFIMLSIKLLFPVFSPNSLSLDFNLSLLVFFKNNPF